MSMVPRLVALGGLISCPVRGFTPHSAQPTDEPAGSRSAQALFRAPDRAAANVASYRHERTLVSSRRMGLRSGDLTLTVQGSEQSSHGVTMSVYKIEIVGTSSSSWEDAAVQAVNTAKETLRDLRVAEVVEQDLDLAGDEVVFRTKLSISFKYQAD